MPALPVPEAPASTNTSADAAALAAAAAQPGSPGHYDELRGRPNAAGASDTALAPLWRRFFSATGRNGWRDMPSRRTSVQRKVLEDGASYNVHAPEGASARTWPLELLPLLVGADEWAVIERGVCQRVRLLEAALSDIYGPRRLLEEGLLPATLIHGHPQYLRPMHGVQPPGGCGLHLVAVDLARGPDGRWWVVGHRTQAPSGLGYLLENRVIIGQQFPEAFRELRVQRVASTFRALLDGLVRASGAGSQARLALLTPGPHNETYFEHVYLARYLGLTLVEGSDLTVRDQRLYLKTLQGLERVHVLLRRVDDEWLDPLELRADSALGVPGLLEAVRAGELVLANMPGAGVLESPGLTAFWPAVARSLLGEELLLPATTSWWCGEDSVWAQQRESLQDFVIVPTFPASEVTRDFVPVMGASLDAAQRKAWQARIDEDPAAYTLMAPVRPSELPVWQDGRIEPRPMVLRVYALR
ncbi:MAG TPA: circularly permuted type 2 ATP-grasp protein, partial [Quisquiliibacterium sp.]|nr:circularly permuted type 2 ATP-grasp protein [Quisquiliibacterium sp.]